MRSIFFVPPNAFLLARANRDLWSPFGNAQIIKAIQENNNKKVYAFDVYSSNYFFVQKRWVLVYGEEMTHLEKQERKKKKNNKRIKKKIYPFWDKKKNDDKLWYSDYLFWENWLPPSYMPFDAIGKWQ